MTTTADLIFEARRHLQSLQREPMNRLAAPATVDATTLSFEFDTSAIQFGAHLQLGLELVYVWSVDTAGKTATVQRAQLGSTGSAHVAGTVVTVNPKFPDFAILKAINDDLADLSSPVNGLYAVRGVDLSFVAGASGYDLPVIGELLEVIEVRQRLGASASYRQWPVLTNHEISRNVSAVDFPSGVALFLHEGAGVGQPIRVLYKAGFGRLTNLTDDVEFVAGLPESMHDLPPMGAAVRLVAPREIKRNFTESQPDSRRAAEVPPGAVGNSVRLVAGARQSRITSEAAKLAQQYPERGFIPQSNSAYGGWRGGYARGGRRW